MHESPCEVVILRPTYLFPSLFTSELGKKMDTLSQLMRTDNTAYVIQKHPNDEETINEIERHYAFMFRHEISRWLGHDCNRKIDASFLDFLCCFKFEMHSQIMLLEKQLQLGRQVLRIYPRDSIFQWIKTIRALA